MSLNYSRFLNKTAAIRKPSIFQKIDVYHDEDFVSLAWGLPNPDSFLIQEGSFTLTDGRKLSIGPDLMKISLQYGDCKGYEPLCKQLQSLTLRLHSPPCWPTSSQFITSGSQVGITMIIEMIMEQGDYVIVEEPCYSGTLSPLKPYQPKFLGIEVDEDGMKPEKLRAALSRWKPEDARLAHHGVPKFLYTNPNGCNPTGGVTSTKRRQEIYKIASEYNLLIIEDDPYYFIQFQDPKDFPPSYLSLDIDGRVLRLDSFSKTLSAGLRVAYVTGPKPLIDKLLCYQIISVCQAPSISQVMISEIFRLMGEDGFLEHIQKVRKIYETRRNAALEFAEKHLIGLCEWTVPAGGMFLWLKILGISDSYAFMEKARCTTKVQMIPGIGFTTDTSKPSSYLRLSFSIADLYTMEEGFRRLALAIRTEIKEKSSFEHWKPESISSKHKIKNSDGK